MMASALLGVISGSPSSCSRLAELMSSGLLRLKPSLTPCATAVASRLMAAVASAARSRTASGELELLLHPMQPATRSKDHNSFIRITMPRVEGWIAAFTKRRSAPAPSEGAAVLLIIFSHSVGNFWPENP
jgi:hypothetical protein